MMTRKQFFGSMAGLLGLATLGACGTDVRDEEGKGSGDMPDAGTNNMGTADAAVQTPPPDAPTTTMACASTAVTIGSNHGHALTVSSADVTAGVEKTYSIQGTSTHGHMVKITAAMFATLKSTGMVMATSTSDFSHTHSVKVTCPI